MKRTGSPETRRRKQKAEPAWTAVLGSRQDNTKQRVLDKSLADVGLQVRTINTLESASIFQVKDLASKTREELLNITNFGESTLADCRRLMAELGVETPNWKRPPRRARRSKA